MQLGFLVFRFELAAIEQQVPFLPDQLSFLLQVALHGPAKLTVNDVMGAHRRARVEPAQLFETPAGPGFKASQAQTNAMLDGRVVTDVKMEKGQILECAPIPSVHRFSVTHIEGSRNDLTIAFRQHKANMLG
jgi:hypothetical protein